MFSELPRDANEKRCVAVIGRQFVDFSEFHYANKLPIVPLKFAKRQVGCSFVEEKSSNFL